MIRSTAVGQLVDSALFYPIAFLEIWQPGTMMKVIAFNWSFKVSVEIVFTPDTYAIVRWLKRQESEDWYDRQTNCTLFSLKD
jgi:queuosine precursor transporter